MIAELHIGEVAVDLVFKDIKNIHLSVYPPTGRVRIAAPARMNIETVRAFAISKLGWIRQHQIKFAEQERETPREFLERESHYLWGRRFLLEIFETQGKPCVELDHRKIRIYVKPNSELASKEALIDELYRDQMRQNIEPLVAKWERALGVTANKIFIQKMKTQWGSCNHVLRNIRLNLELAKKPDVCLDYILLHEFVHFLVPTHGAQFVQMMDRHMFNWRIIRQQLNDEPLSHLNWKY